MVIFNELRISEDKQCITVDVEIEDVDGYDGMYIDGIYLEYYKNASDSGDLTPGKYFTMYEHAEGDDDTHVRKRVTIDDIEEQMSLYDFGTPEFDKGLFFVHVHCDGTPVNGSILEGYGCGADNTWDTGIILDWKAVYEYGMGYAAKLAKSCGNPCDEPTGFKQFILLWYALQLAISTCDYSRVRGLWDRILKTFSGFSGASLSSGCGCK